MIDYVVIASDDNPKYKDFYPIVARRWLEMGYKTFYIHITDKDEIIHNEFGIIQRIKALDFVSTGFQSQVVRLFACNLVVGNLLMSDIDMLPINRQYFIEKSLSLKDDNVVIFTGQPYGVVPYYPMCYILSHSENYQKYLNIKDMKFDDYCRLLITEYTEKWNTDEHFMYERFQNHLDKLFIFNDRDLSRRVNRAHWRYDLSLLEEGFYIDSHMLRPYLDYKTQIDELIFDINKTENIKKSEKIKVLPNNLSMENYCNLIKEKTNIYPETILEIGSRDAEDSNFLSITFQIPDENVWVVEPNPFQQHIISKKYPNFNLITEAIFSEEGKLNFNLVKDQDLIGISSLFDRVDNIYSKIDSEVITVDVIKGKVLLDRIKSDIDLCKIDVEGATYEVLNSFGGDISKIKSFHLENEHQEVWQSQHLYSDIEKFLLNSGFQQIYFEFVNNVKLQSDSIWVQKKYLR